MKRTLCYLSAIALTLGIGAPASAQEGTAISGNVTLASDYSFRGWSQTTRDFAIQGGFDIEFENGFSIGTWASNVNFGTDTSMELDLYAGLSNSLNESMDWSISFIRFEYPSDGADLDYNEVHFGLTFNDLSIGLAYSPSYLGDSGPSFTYPNVGYSIAVSDTLSLDLAAGISSVDEDNFFGEDDSYMDYSASITLPLGGADFSIALVGTNLDIDDPATENRLIFSLSKSL